MIATRLRKSKIIDSIEAAKGYSSNSGDYLRPQNQVKKKVISTQDKTQTEDQVVKVCTLYLKKEGWITYTLFTGGIPIGEGRYATNPCKGIPDCIAFHLQTNKTIWIEYKKSHGGLISPEQDYWHKMLRHCGSTVFVVNSLSSLKDQLSNLSL